MKTIFLAAAAAALLAAAPAFAADDIMANYLGNTVVSTGGMTESHNPLQGRPYVRPRRLDDGHEQDLRGHLGDQGRPALPHLCRRAAAGPAGNPFCTPWEAHKVGDTWTMTMGGNSRDLTLKAGIQ